MVAAQLLHLQSDDSHSRARCTDKLIALPMLHIIRMAETTNRVGPNIAQPPHVRKSYNTAAHGHAYIGLRIRYEECVPCRSRIDDSTSRPHYRAARTATDALHGHCSVPAGHDSVQCRNWYFLTN